MLIFSAKNILYLLAVLFNNKVLVIAV